MRNCSPALPCVGSLRIADLIGESLESIYFTVVLAKAGTHDLTPLLWHLDPRFHALLSGIIELTMA